MRQQKEPLGKCPKCGDKSIRDEITGAQTIRFKKSKTYYLQGQKGARRKSYCIRDCSWKSLYIHDGTKYVIQYPM